MSEATITEPATDTTAPDGAAPAAATEGDKEKRTRAKAPDTSKINVDAIQGAALAAPSLIAASVPERARSDAQKAMDAVATRAYDAWLKAGKPTLWQKTPVVTYFLTPEEVPAYRYLIRRACDIVEPAEGSPGVRVRFGNEFTLTEAQAKEIDRPSDAGKTVLAWTAIDKRNLPEPAKKDDKAKQDGKAKK